MALNGDTITARGVFLKQFVVIREKMRLPKKRFFKMGSDSKKERVTGRLFYEVVSGNS
jgi:hypothetical protein